MVRSKKTYLFIIIIITTLGLFFIIYSKYFKNEEKKITEEAEVTETENISNIIRDVHYSTIDTDGNEYIVYALQGEIDYTYPEVLFLTKVKAEIKLANSSNITIISDFGKFNSNNFDTIFSKNVNINYIDNKIVSEYLDFSLERNSMIISRNVIYTNLENVLKADVIELNLNTKDTKIFMYEEKNKVNIINKSLNGNNQKIQN